VLDIALANSGLTAHNIIIASVWFFKDKPNNPLLVILFELFPGAKATIGF
jgi:hypothetical protein